MRRFYQNIQRYAKYCIFSAKAELQAEVNDSYLGALWWLLDPLLFMCVYTFVYSVVFGKTQQYLSAFIFIGLSAWKFFNGMIVTSVKLIRSGKAIVTKVYVPKYILVLEKLYVYLFKMGVSFMLVFVMMVLYRVPFSFKWVLMFIPLTLVLVTVTFGCSCIIMHFGVFVDDLTHVVEVLLRLMFYLSGVFYDITARVSTHPTLAKLLLKVNPMAFLMASYRQVMLFDTWCDIPLLLIWFVVGCVLSMIGVRLIHVYENSYAKVV